MRELELSHCIIRLHRLVNMHYKIHLIVNSMDLYRRGTNHFDTTISNVVLIRYETDQTKMGNYDSNVLFF